MDVSEDHAAVSDDPYHDDASADDDRVERGVEDLVSLVVLCTEKSVKMVCCSGRKKANTIIELVSNRKTSPTLIYVKVVLETT